MARFCPTCATQNSDSASFCISCGSPLAAPGVAPAVPVFAPAPATTSGKAVASLVLGLVGFVSCGLCGICGVLGIVGLILGLMAKADIRRSGGQIRGSGLATAGIVVGVLSLCWGVVISAAISIPGFLEAQTRAKVARVQSDSRSLATAIESFAVDKNTYPTRLSELTTPVAYITALPLDPFADKSEPSPDMRWLAYSPVPRELERGQTRYGGWILASRGPDGVLSVDFARDLPAGKQLKPDEIQSLLLDKTYDPSNGTNSAGDIFKYSSGTSFYSSGTSF